MNPATPELVTVARYGARNWAVYVGEELLCVTVYRKGARSVQNAILNLFSALPADESRKERAA